MTREEAINVIRSIYQTGAEREALAILVPELRESEDERIRKWLLECVENLSNGNFIAVSRQDVLFYLEKQKEQRPAERSEEDEKMLQSIIIDFRAGKVSTIGQEQWLKSLRPSWKPSENQMSMLLAVVNDPNNAGSASCHLSLESLYNDLKKL